MKQLETDKISRSDRLLEDFRSEAEKIALGLYWAINETSVSESDKFDVSRDGSTVNITETKFD